MQIPKKIASKTTNKNAKILKRYDYIDALRGIAIIGVLFAHTGLYSNIIYPSWLQNLAEINLGPRGVQLFYLVSAFTLCLSFSKRKTFEKHGTINFYIRRFFRIAPLFYLSIIYYLWQQNYWNANPSNFSILNILTTFTFTNGAIPSFINNIVFGGWSIAVESTFYLIFPVLFYIFYKLKTIKAALILTTITAIAMQIFRTFLLAIPMVSKSPDLQTYTFQFFPSQLPVFLIGILVFLFMKQEFVSKYKKFISFFFIGLILLFILQIISPIKLIAGHYIFGIIFGLLTYLLSKNPLKLLVNPITIFIGKISFSLYLCHVAVMHWLIYFGLNNYLPTDPYLNFIFRFLVLLCFSSLVATLLFFTVEKGGIALGKRVINRHEKNTPTNTSAAQRTW
jgi:peptidoglycan/LPS O-acetylase OafA/YrhL